MFSRLALTLDFDGECLCFACFFSVLDSLLSFAARLARTGVGVRDAVCPGPSFFAGAAGSSFRFSSAGLVLGDLLGTAGFLTFEGGVIMSPISALVPV